MSILGTGAGFLGVIVSSIFIGVIAGASGGFGAIGAGIAASMFVGLGAAVVGTASGATAMAGELTPSLTGEARDQLNQSALWLGLGASALSIASIVGFAAISAKTIFKATKSNLAMIVAGAITGFPAVPDLLGIGLTSWGMAKPDDPPDEPLNWTLMIAGVAVGLAGLVMGVSTAVLAVKTKRVVHFENIKNSDSKRPKLSSISMIFDKMDLNERSIKRSRGYQFISDGNITPSEININSLHKLKATKYLSAELENRNRIANAIETDMNNILHEESLDFNNPNNTNDPSVTNALRGKYVHEISNNFLRDQNFESKTSILDYKSYITENTQLENNPQAKKMTAFLTSMLEGTPLPWD